MSSHLVEPGMKYFMNETLKQCCSKKYDYYNHLYNLILGVTFIVGFSIFLMYCFQEKKNIMKKRQQEEQKELYLTNIVNQIQLEERRKKNELITQLPTFEANQIVNSKQFL